MSDYLGLAQKIATVLETMPALARAYYYPLSNPSPPCAIVVPDDNLYNLGYDDGSGEQNWVVRILTGKVSEKSAVAAIYQFLDRTGTNSVRAVLEADLTLGGLCDTLVVEGHDRPSVFGYAGAELLGVDFNVVINK